jgi:hypothetical protein
MTQYDHGYPVDIDRLCVATTKRGRPCQNPPLVGQDRCAYHGGQVAERDRRFGESLNEARVQSQADARAQGRCVVPTGLGGICNRPAPEQFYDPAVDGPVCRKHAREILVERLTDDQVSELWDRLVASP